MQKDNIFVPTKRTLFTRQCKIWQFLKFMKMNMKILRLVWTSHQH